MYNYRLSGPGFDFMELQTELMTFGNKEMMERRALNALLLCAEELTVQGLKNLGNAYFPADHSYEDKNLLTLRIKN